MPLWAPLVLGLLLLLSCSGDGHQSTNSKGTIFIGLALDERSLSDAVLLMHSVLFAARRPENVKFLVLACGPDEITASHLRKTIEQHLVDIPSLPLQRAGEFNEYFGGWRSMRFHIDVRAFTLPEDSGFGAQLSASTVKQQTTQTNAVKGGHKRHRPQHSHWNSPSGADMARFFLPQQFADVVTPNTSDRILYLDNDIIVSCCLEEIFFSDLAPHSAAGVVLDDLKWATATQFERHYNASHPLVVQHMRIGHRCAATSSCTTQQRATGEVEKNEFVRAVPRYPNDGVLLFAVSRYLAQGVLADMDAIARANSEDFVVNLGTQQFTVLALHDRWTELTPRANLRHFPDMARGFLMWFYYHGFLHYAGQHKPAGLCLTDAPLTPFSNPQRMASLTPWLVALHHLYVARHSLADALASCRVAPVAASLFCAQLASFAGSGSVAPAARRLQSPFGADPAQPGAATAASSAKAIATATATATEASAAAATAPRGDDRVLPLQQAALLWTPSPPSHSCLSMLATAPTFDTFAQLLLVLANGAREENLVYLRLGDVASAAAAARVLPYVASDSDTWSSAASQRLRHWLRLAPAPMSATSQATFFPQNRHAPANRTTPSDADLLRVVDDIAATGHAAWSFAVFPLDGDPSGDGDAPLGIVREKIVRDYRAAVGDSFFAPQPATGGDASVAQKKPRFHYAKTAVRRSFDVFDNHRPSGGGSGGPPVAPLCRRASWRDHTAALEPSDCRDVLTQLRAMQRKHWEVVTLTAHSDAPQRLLGHLAALDMHFMRPPLAFLSLDLQPDVPADAHAAEELRDWLRHQGYVVGLQHRRRSAGGADSLFLWGVRLNHAEVATALQSFKAPTL